MFEKAIQPLIAQVAQVTSVESRITQVQAAITDRMQEQMMLLAAITSTQTQHSTDLATLHKKEQVNHDTIQEIQSRLTKLETQPPHPEPPPTPLLRRDNQP